MKPIRLSEKSFIHGPLFAEDNVSIGDVEVFPNVYFGMYSYMVSGLVRSHTEVGRYCAIGRYVTIGAGEHNIDALSIGGPLSLRAHRTLSKRAAGRPDRRVVVEHDVWIGDKVTILAGITIHTGAVIGSNAVVTRDVSPYTIVAGVPARPVRMRFKAEIAERLLASRWWEIDPALMENLDVNNIDSCLAFFEAYEGPRIVQPIFERHERKVDFSALRDQIKSLKTEIAALRTAKLNST